MIFEPSAIALRWSTRCPIERRTRSPCGWEAPTIASVSAPTTTENLQPRLDQLGALLCSCRDLYFAMWDLNFHEPASQHTSAAWEDFRMLMTGPDGKVWPSDANTVPRSVAVKLLHQQADYCYALGLLVASAEGGDPASTLLRSIVEYAAREFWVLDPDVAVDHRGRCARAMLLELVSLHHARDAAADLPADPVLTEQRDAAKTQFKQMKQVAAARFNDVELANDPGKWSIEGHRYASWTDATEAWARANDIGVNGAGLYKLLSVLGHPQGFAATFGLTVDPTGRGTRTITIRRVEMLTQAAVAAFYSALTLLANYTGHRPQALLDWEDRADQVLPDIFAALPLGPAR